MKYRLLLKLLRILVYIKRFFWWLGARIYFVLGKITQQVARPFFFLSYKSSYLLKKAGITKTRQWLLERGFLQLITLGAIFTLGLGHTTLPAKKNLSTSGQKTILYSFLGVEEEGGLQEVVSTDAPVWQNTPAWRAGAVVTSPSGAGSGPLFKETALTAPVAGGTALTKPILLPGAAVGTNRNQVTNYEIEAGDSLGSIAYGFGVSIPTLMWENNLTLKSIIRPGDVLKIPPTTGVMHTIKKGDTIKKIAGLYEAKPEDIINFNHLKENGSDIRIGERIMVPNGVKPRDVEIVRVARTTQSVVSRVAAPPSSNYAPSASGFVWPSGAHMITQYFGITHHAVDIAGPWQTPTYAAKEGIVEKSQCGWNSGYGCYVIINHGGGVKTLYGHHSVLLVNAGDHVTAGQTIALMGNTGHVRGVTGIHLHFEVIVNGVRVNPLGYVR